MQVVLSTCIKSSCGYQVLTSLMEQLGPGLMNASMLMQVARIRLAASCYPQACCKFLSAGLLQVVIHWLVASCYQACKLFRQFAASLWTTSLDKSDKQLAASLLRSGLLQLDICRLSAS
jgi:hypothetical protein